MTRSVIPDGVKDWILRNWKQTLVLILSASDFVVLHYHPEWHDQEALVAAILLSWGIRLLPITVTQNHANEVANKALMQASFRVIPNLEKPFQDSHNQEDTKP